jgi:hypothetical protein
LSTSEDTTPVVDAAPAPESPRWRRRLRAAVSKRYRPVRVLAYALLLFVLPWLYIENFTPPPGPVALPRIDDDVHTTVYVVGWNHHSSILVEQRPEWRLGPEGNEETRFVEYGWGDRRFMMESNYWPHSLFATLFLPTESVAYVRGLDELPEPGVWAEFVRRREVDGRQLRTLLTALEDDFVRTADGRRAGAFPPVEGYAGRFYPGREYYVIWWNCNWWVVRSLRDGGFDVSPTGVFVAQQIEGRLVGFE